VCILKQNNLFTKNKIHATSYLTHCVQFDSVGKLKEIYSVHFCALSFGDLYTLHVSVTFHTILTNTDTGTNWNITSTEDKEKLL
jgi:hypothetical protein